MIQHRKNTGVKLSNFFIACGVAALLGAAYLQIRFSNMSFGAPFLTSLSLCCFGYGWLLGQVRRGKYVLAHQILRGAILLGFISFIGAECLVWQGMKTNLPDDCQYVIVLGAGLTGDYPSLTLRERLDAGLTVLNQYPASKAIVSGGLGKESNYTEAEVMKNYLMMNGIAPERIIKEEQATRTDENFKFGKAAAAAETGKPADEIVVATSDYHMFRAKLIAQKYYAHVYGAAAESSLGIRINYALREYFALVKMALWDSYEKDTGTV